MLKSKFNIEMKWWLKAVIVFLLFVVLGSLNSPDGTTEKVTTSNPPATTKSVDLQETPRPDTTRKPNDNPDIKKEFPRPEVTENTNSDTPDLKKESGSTLKVHFIDVGQADCILLQESTGHNMLIDAGNNADKDLILNYLKSQGIKSFDYVVGSHSHEDHIGSLDSILSTFDIGKILMPKVTSNTKTFEDVVNAIKNKGLTITLPEAGRTYDLGNAKITVLAPIKNDYNDTNDFSIVLKVAFGNNSFLFTGDAEEQSEGDILSGANAKILKSDVLKVGHHGSSSSTSKGFLQAVSPKYAIISVGKDNDYGHPHKETMQALQNNNIPIYRTDQNGTIVAVSDGNNITFNVKPGNYNFGSEEEKKVVESPVSPIIPVKPEQTQQPAKVTESQTAPVIPIKPEPTQQPTQNQQRIVYYTPNGKSYHYSKSCSTLSRSKTIIEVSLQEAINTGHGDPCDRCTR